MSFEEALWDRVLPFIWAKHCLPSKSRQTWRTVLRFVKCVLKSWLFHENYYDFPLWHLRGDRKNNQLHVTRMKSYQFCVEKLISLFCEPNPNSSQIQRILSISYWNFHETHHSGSSCIPVVLQIYKLDQVTKKHRIFLHNRILSATEHATIISMKFSVSPTTEKRPLNVTYNEIGLWQTPGVRKISYATKKSICEAKYFVEKLINNFSIRHWDRNLASRSSWPERKSLWIL